MALKGGDTGPIKAEIEAKIEYQQLIGESDPGGYQPVRFSRIKYKANSEPHIDIRRYQRAISDDGECEYYPTKLGLRFPERQFRRVVGEYALMPESYVHPSIVNRCFPLMTHGHYESAILEAFKLIEIAIRERIHGNTGEVGTRLIRKAFNADKGQLADMSTPVSEREALCNYVAGAFGYYRNPCSHRKVHLDFTTTFDKIVVASELMKIVERTDTFKEE